MRVIAILVLAAVLALSSAAPAKAQGSPQVPCLVMSDWINASKTYTWNGADNNYEQWISWTLPSSWADASLFYAGYIQELSFGASSNVSSFSGMDGDLPLQTRNKVAIIDSAYLLDMTAQADEIAAQYPQYTRINLGSAAFGVGSPMSAYVRIWGGQSPWSAVVTHRVRFILVSDTPTVCQSTGSDPLPGTLTRPLGPYDRVDWEDANEGMFDLTMSQALGDLLTQGDANITRIVSKNPDQPVMSVVEGTVIGIVDFNPSLCSLNTQALAVDPVTVGLSYAVGILTSDQCYFPVPGQIAPGAGNLPWMYRIDTSNAAVVAVETTTGEIIHYWVSEPQVSVGDTVAAGCIIGTTASLIDFVGGDTNAEANLGGAFLYAFDPDTEELVRLLPLLTVDADPLTACNINSQFSSCRIRDPQLRDPSAWSTVGAVQWDASAGAVLQPGAGISVLMPLTNPMGLNIQARAQTGLQARLRLQLGQTTQTFDMASTTEYAIPSGTHAADGGQLYMVSVDNVGSAPITLSSVCVSDGTAQGVPAQCGFVNPSFDFGLSSWQKTGDVFLGLQAGEIWMENNTTIEQSILLYPAGAQAYQYAVTLDASIPAEYTALAGEVTFQYQYTDSTWRDFLSPASTPDYDFAAFFSSNPSSGRRDPQTVIFQALVNVSTMTNAPFRVRALISGAPADAGVLVRAVCVNDPWANYPDTTGGTQLPFQISCTRVSPPSGNDVGAWTFFLWSSLDRFFQCDLMVQLNRMFNTSYKTYEQVRWWMLYQQASTDVWTRWMGAQLVPWLNAHFANIARGNVTVVNNEGYQCEGFWCLIQGIGDGLNTIASFVDTILTLLRVVFAVGLWVINQLLWLAGIGLQLLGTLLSAWNTAQPATIPGLTNCNVNPPTGLCQGIWILDNTIFSPGSRGALFIPLLVGIFSIHLALWVISRVRSTIERIGAAS